VAFPPQTLPELLQQLKRTFSPYERLKILGRAWGLLRQMTPDERIQAATLLGLDNADELVESIAARSGKAPDQEVLSMIEKAQRKGTAALPQLLTALRDPKQRDATLKQGMAALEGAFLEPPPLPTARPAPPPAAPPAPAPVAPPPVAPPPVAVAPQPPPKTAVAVSPVLPTTPPPSLPIPAVPAPAPVLVEVKPVEVKPVEVKPVTPPQSPRPAPEPARPSGDGALAGRLAETPSLLGRFRLLRRHEEDAGKLSIVDLRALLDGFPDGWARRRALLDLLRAGTPDGLRDALSLVESLASERDRLWCLGALADSRRLSAGEREALLGAVASPTARRRLERRLEG